MQEQAPDIQKLLKRISELQAQMQDCKDQNTLAAVARQSMLHRLNKLVQRTQQARRVI